MPAQPSSSPLQTLRTGLWHLRRGGVSQLRTWRRRRRTASYGTADGSGSADAAGGLTFPVATGPERAPHFEGLRVAVIWTTLDRLELRFETVAVTPSGGGQLAEAPVDLLLVESAWHGNRDAWQYQLTGSQAPTRAAGAGGHCQRASRRLLEQGGPAALRGLPGHGAAVRQVFTTDVTLLPRTGRSWAMSGWRCLRGAVRGAQSGAAPARPSGAGCRLRGHVLRAQVPRATRADGHAAGWRWMPPPAWTAGWRSSPASSAMTSSASSPALWQRVVGSLGTSGCSPRTRRTRCSSA